MSTPPPGSYEELERAVVARSLAEMKAGRAFGYQITDLEADFKALTAGMANWKDAIDVVVPAETDVARLDAAVCYYTGGGIDVVKVPGGLRVLAAGYYHHIGS